MIFTLPRAVGNGHLGASGSVLNVLKEGETAMHSVLYVAVYRNREEVEQESVLGGAPGLGRPKSLFWLYLGDATQRVLIV